MTLNTIHNQNLGPEAGRPDVTPALSEILNPLAVATKSGLLIYDSTLSLIYASPPVQAMIKAPEAVVRLGAKSKLLITFMSERGDFGSTAATQLAHQSFAEFEETKANFKSSEVTWTYKDPEGRDLQFKRICNGSGRVILCIQDITNSTKNEDLLKSALSMKELGYWSYLIEDDKYEISPSIRDHFTPDVLDKIQKQGFWSVVHPDDVENTRALWKDAFVTGQAFDISQRLLTRFGTRYFRMIGKPEFSTSGKALGAKCFVIDCTKTYEAAAILEKSQETALSALKANNQFLAHLSHEIRTPMNGIMGMTDALIFGGKCKHVEEHLDVIKRSADSLLRIMDDTLEHAKLSTSPPKINAEPASPKQTVSHVCKLWHEKALKNGTQLKVHLDSSLPESLVFDQFRYEQCLNNLISNAVKFTANGKVSVVSALVSKNGKHRFVTAVKDTGIGMTAEQQTHVFTPYEQADDSISKRFGGTGLGMAITKTLIELMGGTIKIKSELGVGTTFVLSLPIDMKKAIEPPIEPQISSVTSAKTLQSPAVSKTLQANEIFSAIEADYVRSMQLKPVETRPNPVSPSLATPTPADTPKPTSESMSPPRALSNTHEAPPVALLRSRDDDMERLSRASILVAEDNPTNQLVVRSLLEPLVGQIYFAGNGRDAIDILENQAIDIVLMDIHMPIMDGIEATIAIRSSDKPYSKVGIIALTADPEYQQKRICKNLGMNDALSKPVNRDEIISAFTILLDQSEVRDNEHVANMRGIA